MAVQTGNSVTIEFHSTTTTAETVTAVTKENPGVATASGHALTSGDYGYFTISDGMQELDTQVCRVGTTATNTFTLSGVDTSNYTTWDSGTFTPVATWATLCLATSYSVANAAPTEIDATTTCDTVARIRFGLPGAKSGSITINHDASSTTLATLEARSESAINAVRTTYSDGSIRVFGCYQAYGGGYAGGVNTLETGDVPITVPARIVNYTS